MTESQRIEMRRSKVRERLAEVAKLEGDAYTPEVRAEEVGLQDEYGQLETRFRTALLTESEELKAARGRGR